MGDAPGAGGAGSVVDASSTGGGSTGGVPGVSGAGNQGGTGAIGGAEAGGTDECSSAFTSTIRLSPWQPRPPSNLSVAEALQQLEREMSGAWRGIARTPVGWNHPEYEVKISFGEGQYSAQCTSHAADCCLAFYYGSDRDFPTKRFRLVTTDASGRGFGEVDIVFDYGGVPGPPTWQGLLQNVEVDATGNRLRFEFKTSAGYGPIRYDLERI